MPVDDEQRGDDRGQERAWRRAEACVIERARQGDARAFALLWMRFEPKIAAFTRRMCGHYHLTRGDDAWGDVYLAVARSMTTFDPDKIRNPDGGAAFCNWAYRIAARVVLNHVVKRHRVATVEVGIDDWEALPDAARMVAAVPGPAEHFTLQENVGRVYERIAADGNAGRAAYLRLIVEGTSQQDAAAAIGINPSTGRSWLKRFRLDLEAEQNRSDPHIDFTSKKRG